jgi:hypothetical protein
MSRTISRGSVHSRSDPGSKYVYNIFSAADRKSERLIVRVCAFERAEVPDSGES